jgi:toxin ParE1/3/4
MSHFRVSEEAEGDLKEIWTYVAEDNVVAADRLVDALFARFTMLAGQKEMGRLRKELATNLRSHAVGNYVIFYRFANGGIEIVRVLHGARNLPPLFE